MSRIEVEGAIIGVYALDFMPLPKLYNVRSSESRVQGLEFGV
jgi:hypothetical protein